MADVATPQPKKGEFLRELVDNYNKWVAVGTPEALEYAAAYEHMLAAFTTPKK